MIFRSFAKFEANMYYPEYAIAARTHYKSCKFLYDSCIWIIRSNLEGLKTFFTVCFTYVDI